MIYGNAQRRGFGPTRPATCLLRSAVSSIMHSVEFLLFDYESIMVDQMFHLLALGAAAQVLVLAATGATP
jgi:hypothetical protein